MLAREGSVKFRTSHGSEGVLRLYPVGEAYELEMAFAEGRTGLGVYKNVEDAKAHIARQLDHPSITEVWDDSIKDIGSVPSCYKPADAFFGGGFGLPKCKGCPVVSYCGETPPPREFEKVDTKVDVSDFLEAWGK